MIFFPHWYQAGIEQISDLSYSCEGHFLPFNSFCNKFNVKCNFLQYYSIPSSLTIKGNENFLLEVLSRRSGEQLLRIFRALQTSWVLHISMNARWRMNQLFYNIFSPMEKIFFARDLFADVMSVHNRNMKHARAIEFD